VEIPIGFIKFIIAEIILGLEVIHNSMICHRDLKPDNIMFDENFHIKIGDFGEGKKFEPIDRKLIQSNYDEMV